MKKGGKDKSAGMAIMAVGILIGIGAMTLQVTSIARYGARMMPLVVASSLFVLGLTIFLQGRRVEKAERDSAGEQAEAEMKKPNIPSLPVTLTFILLAAYVLAINPIGFPIATFAYVLAQTYILSNFNKKKLFQAALIALIGTVSIYYIFTSYFHVLLPSGIFG